jgi:putative transposase
LIGSTKAAFSLGGALQGFHYAFRIVYSRPRRPTENALLKIFNGRLGDECLNVHWLETLDDVLRLIDACRIE